MNGSPIHALERKPRERYVRMKAKSTSWPGTYCRRRLGRLAALMTTAPACRWPRIAAIYAKRGGSSGGCRPNAGPVAAIEQCGGILNRSARIGLAGSGGRCRIAHGPPWMARSVQKGPHAERPSSGDDGLLRSPPPKIEVAAVVNEPTTAPTISCTIPSIFSIAGATQSWRTELHSE
jgi:hypothetical protein